MMGIAREIKVHRLKNVLRERTISIYLFCSESHNVVAYIVFYIKILKSSHSFLDTLYNYSSRYKIVYQWWAVVKFIS
jgi:hypothetical protein